jgi:hypothetical protein
MRWQYSIHSQNKKFLFIFFALLTVSLLLSAILYLFGPPLIPLWYSLPSPAEQLAPKVYFWVFPILSVLVAILAIWQGRKSNLEHSFYLSRLAFVSGLVLLALLLIAQVRIMKVIL